MPLALKDPWQQVGGGQLSRQGSAAGAASNGAPTANNVASAKEKEATKQQVRPCEGKKINSPHFRFFLRHIQIRVPDPASSGVSDTDEDPDSSRSQENEVRD